MKTPEAHNEKLTRWLDGAMKDLERDAFETELAASPVLRAEAEDLRKLSGLLRSHVITEKPLPNPDFFNSQIHERIAELHRSEERVKSRTQGASWLDWFRTPWAIAAATAAVALGFFISRFTEEKPRTQVLGLYTPNPSIHATSYHSDEADATVLMLDGLDAIPESKDLTAMTVHHSATDPQLASTTLYEAGGKILSVLAMDSRNQPMFLGKGILQ